MYFQFIHSSDSYLQLSDKSSCGYYVGRGSIFRTQAVASAMAPRRESMSDEPKEQQDDVAGLERGKWRAVRDAFRRW